VNGSPRPPKSAHAHPHPANQVTVSAMRVTLSFAKSLDDTLSVNVRNKQLNDDPSHSSSSSSSSSFFDSDVERDWMMKEYDDLIREIFAQGPALE
jgi:hypothetical protein